MNERAVVRHLKKHAERTRCGDEDLHALLEQLGLLPLPRPAEHGRHLRSMFI